MKCKQATALVDELLRRARGTEWPVGLVQTVAIDHASDRWRSHFIHSMSYGQDPYTAPRMHCEGEGEAFQSSLSRTVAMTTCQ